MATKNDRNVGVTIGNTTTVVAASTDRDDRQYLVMSNDSDEVMYIAIGEAAVASQGIRLGVGDYIVFDNEDNINGAFNAICASGGKNMCVFERYIDK